MTWIVPEQYAREANEALWERLGKALEEEDWGTVEAAANSLYRFALTFTKPKGENA